MSSRQESAGAFSVSVGRSPLARQFGAALFSLFVALSTCGSRAAAAAPLAPPGPTTVACAYSAGDCWVTGSFLASVTPSTGGTGSITYQICRSVDSSSTGFNGCDVNLTLDGGTSIGVYGDHLPADGYRRNYWFQGHDSSGAYSGWNVPLSVRVDRYPPTVSATNASNLWYPSRTATVSAADSTVSASANSGLATVRYSWGSLLDIGCTLGTAISPGTTLTAPAGENYLYLCARDNTGQVAMWSGQYRVGPAPVPTAPGPTIAYCPYVATDCWVTGDFSISVFPSTGGTGDIVYQICRSIDSTGTGFNGCDVTMTLDGHANFTVTGSHLPADGFRRNYWFRARDALGTYGPWNVPLSVRLDRYPPAVSATNASESWFPSRTATLSANDASGGAGANSGLLALRYGWNSAPNAGCTSGLSAAPGTTLAAPAGDNVLYLCARDNTGQVATWNGHYRVGTPPVSVTTTPSPSQSPHGTTLEWWATASGGSGSGYQFALFRRRPGGSWIPSLGAPGWQSDANLSWTPDSNDVGDWEIEVWVKDGTTPPNANTYGFADSFDPGPVEVVEARSQDFTLSLAPAAATIVRGAQAQLTLSLVAGSGFSGTAQLSVAGLPYASSFSLSPTAIGPNGTAVLTVTTTGSTPPGTYSVVVTGTAGSVTRTAAASLTVRLPAAAGEPVIQSISPEQFDGGVVKTITLTGQNLQRASVWVATADPDPDNPTSRIFPTAGAPVISADGTRIDVQVNCTDPRVMDYYELVVDNGVGQAASRPFRVIPAGPVVDLVTPNQPERGENHVYVLSLAGFNLLHATVRAEPAGALDIFGVDAVDDSHINGLLRVPDDAPLGPVDIVVRDPQGREARITIEILADGASRVATQRIRTQRVDPLTGTAQAGPSPDVLFQRFAVRMPENTEMTSSGLHVRTTAAPEKLKAKSFTFILYYQYTLHLFSFDWSRGFVFDPVTGRIGDAILQELGLGQRVSFGAFILSFHLQVDLTITVAITNSGFTWPEFCIKISMALQIPGFDGFFEQWDFCRGGGWVPFATGSTNSLNASGGSCAQVTQQGPPEDGLIFAEAQQNACCEQPIEVSGSGYAFNGSWFGTPFQVSTPNAGTTTPGAACSCSIDVAPKCLVVGKQQKWHAQGATGSGTYQWSTPQGGSRVSIVSGGNSNEVTLSGINPSAIHDDVTLQVVYTPTSGSSCTQTVSLSVVKVESVPLEFLASGQADPQNDKRVRPLIGLPTLGSVTPGEPEGTGGFFENMQIRARIAPADPELQCRFDFKRWKVGVKGTRHPNGLVVPDPQSCSDCSDDSTDDDEDLVVDPPPGSSIYSLDTPGFYILNPVLGCPGFDGGVKASCLNFQEWLEVDGVRASDDLVWHASTRILCSGGNYYQENAGAGNSIGLGSIDCSAGRVFQPPLGPLAPTFEPPASTESILDLVAQLAESRPSVRSTAHHALHTRILNGEVGEKDRAALVVALLERLNDPIVEGQVDVAPLLAIQLLGELRDPASVPPLIERLTSELTRLVDSDADLFTPAAQALAKIGAGAIEPLLDLAAGGSQEEWRQATGSLELMHTPALVRASVESRLGARLGSQERERLQKLLVRLR